MIASSFGKVFRKGERKANFLRKTLSKSLSFLFYKFFVSPSHGERGKIVVFTNLGIYLNAEKYNLDRIYFGECFIRGKWEHRKGRIELTDVKRALFLRHEGFLWVIVLLFLVLTDGIGLERA